MPAPPQIAVEQLRLAIARGRVKVNILPPRACHPQFIPCSFGVDVIVFLKIWVMFHFRHSLFPLGRVLLRRLPALPQGRLHLIPVTVQIRCSGFPRLIPQHSFR